jgi:hypothetical protein
MNREQLIEAIVDTTLDGMGTKELSIFVAEALTEHYDGASDRDLEAIALDLGIISEDDPEWRYLGGLE